MLPLIFTIKLFKAKYKQWYLQRILYVPWCQEVHFQSKTCPRRQCKSHVQLYRPPGHYAIINRWSQEDKAFSLTLTIPWHKKPGTESKRREEVSVINKVHKVLTSQALLQFSASKGDWTVFSCPYSRDTELSLITNKSDYNLSSPSPLGSRDGAVVRAFASPQSGPSLIPAWWHMQV